MIKLQIESEKKDGIIDLIKTAISAEIKRLEIGLSKTELQITSFEKKYQIPSETFLKELAAEDMEGGDQEYIEWTGELKLKERILEDLKTLKGIEYVTH